MPANDSGAVVCSSSLLLCGHPGRRQAETPLIQPVQKSRASSQLDTGWRGGDRGGGGREAMGPGEGEALSRVESALEPLMPQHNDLNSPLTKSLLRDHPTT